MKALLNHILEEKLGKYHINKKGEVGLCSAASAEKCPFSSPHFGSVEEASLHYEKRMEEGIIVDDKLFSEITKNLKPYTAWNEEILRVHEKHKNDGFLYGAPTSRIQTVKFQMVNFLADNMGYFFDRDQLDLAAKKLGVKSRDIIQSVNKLEQGGMKQDMKYRGKGRYGIRSVEYTGRMSHRSSTGVTGKEKSVMVEAKRELFRGFAEGDFEKGHKDPRKDLTAENLVMQPAEINGPAKDYWLMDDRGLPRSPNPDVIGEKFSLFYDSVEDGKTLVLNLMSYLEKSIPDEEYQELLSHLTQGRRNSHGE